MRPESVTLVPPLVRPSDFRRLLSTLVRALVRPRDGASVRHEMGSPSSAPSSAHLVRPCTRLKGLPDEVARPDLKEPKGLHPRAVHGLEAIVNQYLDAFLFNEGL